MFPRDEMVEYCLYMLEDQKVINNCEACVEDEYVCVVFSWGRCCHWCERRLLPNCLHASEEYFRQYTVHSRAAIEASFPFGRDKYTLDQLMPSVPLAFEYLCRCYFNRTRKQIKERINTMTSLQELVALNMEFVAYGYHRHALRFVQERVNQIRHSTAPSQNLPSGPMLCVFCRSMWEWAASGN
ncbi:hypothetical protein C8R46DRAFT_1218874 [Mycena filopes]|nr:hypothetical protein C8R46DRAFT_1218874 [Mycena filopes]